MKQYKSFLTQLLIITALLMPWTASQALETFSEIGIITRISHDKVSIFRDGDFRFEPYVKIEFPGKPNAKLSDFKAGDMVGVSGKTLSGVNYVNRIVYRRIDIE